jgi:hypothetical protein
MKNILEYYKEEVGSADVLGIADNSADAELLAEVGVSSGCGEPCVKAIDAAAAFIALLREGYGDDRPALVQKVIDALDDLLLLYIRG